jgi:hypothetical protein
LYRFSSLLRNDSELTLDRRSTISDGFDDG